jgi:hypothetical protein
MTVGILLAALRWTTGVALVESLLGAAVETTLPSTGVVATHVGRIPAAHVLVLSCDA